MSDPTSKQYVMCGGLEGSRDKKEALGVLFVESLNWVKDGKVPVNVTKVM